MIGKTLFLALAWATAFNPAAHGADNGAAGARTKPSTELFSQGANVMKIRLTINGKAMTATLIDNATVRDFVSLLPMTLTLEDYASTEKIAYLPKKLSTQGAPAGVDPDIGDITYYGPWGNLAIFYRDFGYSAGLVKLGSFDAGIEALDVRGSLNVTIEAIGK